MSAVNLLSSLREKPTDENPDDGSNPDGQGLFSTYVKKYRVIIFFMMKAFALQWDDHS
ncbi:unnamed protein product [Spodoptera littoralis]|uniref:Uncharacterized protein n=1 Tax=Spodoptera littoralis TaxID=7109 RepID=A0A9P0I7Z1_SPOLI|nr:unnamed protein product [Spodoptera littoralis]CAH1641061.1 unnamed protein product [Spodoptera littoralis]